MGLKAICDPQVLLEVITTTTFRFSSMIEEK